MWGFKLSLELDALLYRPLSLNLTEPYDIPYWKDIEIRALIECYEKVKNSLVM
jgi:hypothetical protein